MKYRVAILPRAIGSRRSPSMGGPTRAPQHWSRMVQAPRGFMSHAYSAEVKSLIQAQMATGKYLSEDDLLREALLRLNGEALQEQEDLQAVLEAIDELEKGDEGMDLDEAFEEVRLAVENRLKA